LAGNFVGALRAFRPLVEGVAKIHENGYVHRDIKPQNVFLSSEDELILEILDLFISKIGMASDCQIQLKMWEAEIGCRDGLWESALRI